MESKKINQLATELSPVLSDLTIIGDPTTGISKKITLSQMASLFTGTVEEYPNLASFPLVGTADTIYIALDTNVLYRWNTGTNAYVELSPNIINSLVFSDANGFDGTISLVGSVATLTITTALTTGSVGFIGASGALLQDNANFFWDDTNNRLGLGTNAPTTAIDVFGSGIIGRLNGTSTNNAFLGFASAGTNRWSIGNVQSDHRFRIYNEATTSELVSILSTGEFGIGIANPTTKLHIDGGATALIANLDANVSVAKSISFRSDNSNRINLEVSGTESGSNAGADLFIRRYSDAGALIDTPLTITRSTGNIGIGGISGSDKLTITGSIRANLGASGISAIFTGTGSNLQINHDGTSTVNLINTGGGGYIFKAGNATTSIFTLTNAGSASFSSTVTAIGYSKFWDGTQGLNIGAFSAGSGYGAIYTQSVTPSTTNFALASNGLSTIINATNDASIVTNNGNGLVVMSTGNVIINNGTTDSGQKFQVVGGNGNQMDLSNTGQRYTQLNFRNNGTQRAFLAIDQTNSEFQIFGQSGFALSLGAGGGERMKITTAGEMVRATIREFAGSVSPASPYTADLRLIITHNGWGGNADSGTVYVEYQGRAYGNNQTTTAFGVITYRLSDNGVSVTNVSTASVTVSSVTISTDVSSNYVLRITFGVAQSVDRASIFARTTNSFVSLISVDTV